jgi:hypothetical protein
VFTPEELDIRHFDELAGAADELAAAGITGVHQLATADSGRLSAMLGWPREGAAEAISIAQRLLLGR